MVIGSYKLLMVKVHTIYGPTVSVLHWKETAELQLVKSVI